MSNEFKDWWYDAIQDAVLELYPTAYIDEVISRPTKVSTVVLCDGRVFNVWLDDDEGWQVESEE